MEPWRVIVCRLPNRTSRVRIPVGTPLLRSSFLPAFLPSFLPPCSRCNIGGYDQLVEQSDNKHSWSSWRHVERRVDRPRAKGVGVPLAPRRGCSRAAPTKKRADLGSSCHVGHGSATLVVGAIERQKLRKPGLMSPTEKPAQTRRKFFLDFF